jgi:hypothetical protein
MHLMIPHASALEPGFAAALRELELPHLARLLGLLQAQPPLGSDEYAPLAPHEQALARLRGVADEAPPQAAWRLAQAGQPVGTAAWALLTPLHLAVGSDQVTAADPAALGLDEASSRAFLDALAPLFPAEEGWQTHWLSPTEWLVAHDSLDGLSGASLERVINRAVDPWMPEARRLRTLQNEVQMQLHGHPLNAAREAAGQLPLNSVWISGCGRARGQDLPSDLQLDERLRRPLLDGDLAAWSLAWQALDAGPLAALLARAQAGEALHLTLCGERLARSWLSQPSSAWQRLRQRWLPRRAAVAELLEAL